MNRKEDTTLAYYNSHSEAFSADTADLEFSSIQDQFLSYLPKGAYILDFGCGAGRDTRYFLKHGYTMDACDGSLEMVKIASRNTGLPVRHMLFQELNETEKYDGIFACASILHVPSNELPDIFRRMHRALKDKGILYVSFKYGTFEGERNGRYFTDLNEEKLAALVKECGGFEYVEQWISHDARPGRDDELWLNLLLRKNEA
jgi:cyclopropane fatty-acyl-phospholipid synthase-like methyltransferase